MLTLTFHQLTLERQCSKAHLCICRRGLPKLHEPSRKHSQGRDSEELIAGVPQQWPLGAMQQIHVLAGTLSDLSD